MTDLPIYRCRRLHQAPDLSVRLERPPWSDAEWIRAFRTVGAGEDTPAVDRFLLAAAAWDDEALYVAFASGPSLVPVTKTQRDDDLFDECTVEIFLAAGIGFYEVEINPLGAVLDLHCPDERQEEDWRKQAEWNAEGMRWAVRAQGENGGHGWMAELILPWSAMPLVTKETHEGVECLRANLCRSQRRPDGTFELTSWTDVKQRFSELDVMGKLLLVD